MPNAPWWLAPVISLVKMCLNLSISFGKRCSYVRIILVNVARLIK